MTGKITILAAIAALSILAGRVNEGLASETVAVESPIALRYMTSKGAIAKDGATIIIGNERLYLWGIMAPNIKNSAGLSSRDALTQLIREGGELACVISKRYATCSNDKIDDVGRTMLRNGWVVVNRVDKGSLSADTALAEIYQRAEDEARETRAGHWVDNPQR